MFGDYINFTQAAFPRSDSPGPKIKVVIFRIPNGSGYSISIQVCLHGWPRPFDPSGQFGQFRGGDGISKTIVLISLSQSTAYKLCMCRNICNDSVRVNGCRVSTSRLPTYMLNVLSFT